MMKTIITLSHLFLWMLFLSLLYLVFGFWVGLAVVAAIFFIALLTTPPKTRENPPDGNDKPS